MTEPLRQFLLDLNADFGADRGAEVALSFGDNAAEWTALNEGAGVIDLGYRRYLRVEGEERAEFLHGQLTADIQGLPTGRGCRAAVLNAQGRALELLRIWNRGEDLVIGCQADNSEQLVSTLERFLVADDVEFVPEPVFAVLGVAGPRATELLVSLGATSLATEAPLNPAASYRYDSQTLGSRVVDVFYRDDLRVPFYEIACRVAEDALSLWAALLEAGALAVGGEALEVIRVESGCVRYGADLDENRLAAESGLHDTIHYAKGCYVGQEVVERAVSRGGLKRGLCLIRLEEELAAGARLVGGAESEVLVSTVESPGLGWLGLGYLPVALMAPATSVRFASEAREVEARVLEWPRPRALLGRAAR